LFLDEQNKYWMVEQNEGGFALSSIITRAGTKSSAETIFSFGFFHKKLMYDESVVGIDKDSLIMKRNSKLFESR